MTTVTAHVEQSRIHDYIPGTFEALKDITNRPDEWRIEQGLSGAKLPWLDQTGEETIAIHPAKPAVPKKDEEAIKALGNSEDLFKIEREGWKG